jgi:hypothetical protein
MRRVFPLYHEGDNAQRLVPLRAMGWQPPSLEPELLELARTTPAELKLDKRVFRMAVLRVCGAEVSGIPDNNTGLPVWASPLRVGLNRYRIAVQRRYERRRRRIASADSWPNWTHYIRSSGKIRALWQRPNPLARELLGDLCGDPFHEDVAAYVDRTPQYFMRLLTLKLWLDQRAGASGSR